jgi:aryl-alcohol dehydrogenase-like predicted oxidoreductase
MVSEVGLGGHTYNIKGGIAKHSFEERMKIISKALDLGINFFDAADSDESSSIVRILKKLNARDKCIIAYGDNVEGFRITNADEKFIRENVESQLRALQTDRIDILRVLDWSISDYAKKMNVSVEREIEGISYIIDKLKREGKVRFSNFTTHLQDNLEGLAGKADIGNLFDTIQIRFNFLENQPLKKIIPYAKEYDMGIIVMKPFRKGTLLNKYCGDSSDPSYADLKLPTDTLFNNLQNKEKGLVYALLKFILSNQDISVVIPGVASVEQLIENANVSIFD